MFIATTVWIREFWVAVSSEMLLLYDSLSAFMCE